MTSVLLVRDPVHTELSLVEAALGLGLRVQNADLEIARGLLGGLRVDEVLRGETAPDEIVRAWDALMLSMANRKQDDSVALLIALAAITILFINDPSRLNGAIRSRGWNAERTASEAAMRLFGTEFNMGRKLIPERNHRWVGRALLVEAIATSAHVSSQLHNPTARIRFYGMRGVAYLLLARGEFRGKSPSKLALLEAASADLAESRCLGDDSPQHFEYEVEALLRRNQLQPSGALLDEADTLLKKVGVVSRRLGYSAGDIYLTIGIQAMTEGMHEDALAKFLGAVEAYSSALRIARRTFDMEDGDIRAKRGYARLRAYCAASKLNIDTPAEDLDDIIDDLECGEADPFSGLTPLPEALFWRSMNFRSSGNLDRAIQDLTRAVDLSPVDAVVPEARDLGAHALCQLAECLLEQALGGGDAAAVESALRELLVIDAELDPSIPLMASAVRRLVMDRGNRFAAPLIREVASKLDILMNRPHCVGTVRAFAASYAAGVLFRLGDLIDEAELRHVCELYTEALEKSEDPPAPEVLGLAGDAKLKLAKVLLSSGSGSDEAVLLLEDAIELFETGITAVDRASDAYDEKTALSKLGETILRLGSITDDMESAEAAARHFERSRSLGNDSPELLGLLGDCYYRIGRRKSDVTELRRAADLKELARNRAAEREQHFISMRENWSLTARIEESIWKISGATASLAAAVRAGLRAYAADPQWPWPVFQLAAMRRSSGDKFNIAVSLNDTIEDIDPRLQAALQEWSVKPLEVFGAELAVRSEEFRRRVLGGRTQVYVLDDPHGLLSGTIVLKRNTRSNAEREAADALTLAEFLRSSGADPLFSVARPLAVVPLDDSHAVYAMQHVKGRDLGSLIVRGLHVNQPLFSDICKRVVDFLAWFHAWSWREGIGTGPASPRELREVAESISSSWRQAGSSKKDAEELRSLLAGVLPAWAVSFRKKDAHPENWLVTANGQVVLIDLESTKQLPVLYDFCQLIDDYPILTVNEEGMQMRKELLAQYCLYLAERIPELCEEPLVAGHRWTVACGFTLFRAAFGLARLVRRERDGNARTSSALRSAAVRRDHYVRLIEWFAREECEPKIAACAQHLAIMVHRLSAKVV